MRKFNPRLSLEIKTADPVEFLSGINKLGIAVHDIIFVDELTVRLDIRSRFLNSIGDALEHTGGGYRVLHKPFWDGLGYLFSKRLLLVICIFGILMLSLYVQNHILFVQVEGNDSLPEKIILQEAQACGVRFGVTRKVIRSEELKNKLLEKIPRVKWLGINTKGCVATILIEEQKIDDVTKNSNKQVGNVVAICDGIVLSKTVMEGTALCKVGQAVKKGEILVSGYTDCGMFIKATCAEAEILALTEHSQNVITPIIYQQRTHIRACSKQYSIQVGKKLIKLYKGSGISEGSCVKIYKQNYMSLPGGFVLPVCFLSEYIYKYETIDIMRDDIGWLTDYSADYLNKHMVAGQVVSSKILEQESADAVSLYADYVCTEMISQREIEESIDVYGFYN